MPTRPAALAWVGLASMALVWGGCSGTSRGPADTRDSGRDLAAETTDPGDPPDPAPLDLVPDAMADATDPGTGDEIPVPEAVEDLGPGDAPGDTDLGGTVEPPIRLLQKSIASPFVEADPLFPLDGSPSNPLVRTSACDTVGVLFRDVFRQPGGTFDTSVIVQVFASRGESAPPRGYLATASSASGPLPISGTLVFTDPADGCRPLVWRASDARPGYDLWTRSEDGSWTSLEVAMGLERALGKVPASLSHRTADLDAKGRIHLLFEAVFGDGSTAGVHAFQEGGDWTIRTYPPPQEVDACVGTAFGTTGILHQACLNAVGDVVHAAFDAGTWNYQVAVPAPNPESAARPSSIALDDHEVPFIAYTRLQRIEDGPGGTPAYVFAQLELATRRNSGAWTSEVITRDSDGFHGGAGVRFTGWAPMVSVGPESGVRVAFADIAAFYDSANVQVLEPGQVRHAYRVQGTWGFQTVFRQRFDRQADPRSGLGFPPLISVSPSGNDVSFLVVERLRPADSPPDGTAPTTIALKLVRTSR